MEDWPWQGGYLNYVLYRMAEEQPDHRNAEIVSGKLQLIGRAYSAAPSRGVSIENFYPKLAEAMVARREELDGAIDSARGIGRITNDDLELVVGVHKLLDDIIVKLLRKNSSANVGHRNSFCSKYLHFHAPNAFPLLDSRVTAALRERKEEGMFKAPQRNGGPTGSYASHCRNLIAYAEANHDPERWTPRTVDGDLYPYKVADTLKSLLHKRLD